MDFLSFKKILIIRLSSLGDVLLTTPMIRSLKKQNPSIEIDFVVRDEYKEILILNPYINKLYTLTREKDSQKLLKEELGRVNYDAVVDLQNNLRSRVITSKIRSPKYRFNKNRLGKILLVRLKKNIMQELPPIPVRYAQTLPGLMPDDKGPEIFSREMPDDVLVSDKKYIGFCPGSKHFTKMWPKEYYIELGIKLTEEGYTIVLFGGRSDIDICREISLNIPGSINACNGDDILKTYVEMKMCKVIVCNDSGLMHTACAAETPVLAIFGSTVTDFGFAPYNNKNIILQNKSLYCRPCSHIGKNSCPEKHFNCMLELKPVTALQMIKQLLDN